ncbi:MAG: hypothetical protein WKF77_15755 [Planctomycetaceae bacterium]
MSIRFGACVDPYGWMLMQTSFGPGSNHATNYLSFGSTGSHRHKSTPLNRDL